uniref:Uncharacterized protein n=1 Tax=mine drainage metagenome TaxID=410659 RepID=E6QMN6_9ZZZZ
MIVLQANHYMLAQSSATTTTGKHHVATKSPHIESQAQQQARANQLQQENDQLKQQLHDRDRQIQQALSAAQQAQAAAQQAQVAAQAAQASAQAASQGNKQNNDAVTNLQQAVQGVKADEEKSTADIIAVRQLGEGMRESYANPIAFKFKGIYITPGGFLAAETADRQRATGGGLNTPFNAIPFSASALGQQTEFVATGRQSRITLNVVGRIDHSTIGGYYEADFLNAGSTSNNNESNSYPLRQRQMWARYQQDRGFTIVGGQMWSLLTETTKGFENKSEAIPFTIDPQYTPGFIWVRQYGMRIYDNFLNKKLFMGVSFENPQMTFGGHGFSNNFTFGTAGNPGGLLNPDANYSINKAPDIIAKIAIEPGFGHYEVAGIAMFLRDRVYPNASTKSATGAYNDDKVAGAVEGAAWFPFKKGLYNIGFRGLYGQSVGRYGSSGLPDTTVHPDGTLAPLHNLSALGSLEFHPGKLDVYYYYGGDYAGRAAYLNTSGQPVGYGSPLFSNSGCNTETPPSSSPYGPGSLSSCTGDTRALTAHDVGFWYSFYRGSKGKLVYGMQYDYMQRKTWAGVGGQPEATDNMFWTSFRYYLP